MSDDVTKRMNYFDRQFLHKDDFEAEQKYHIDRRQRHNRALHQWGAAIGLQVTKKDDSTVTVTEGTAIDEKGYDIVLAENRSVPVKDREGKNLSVGNHNLYIFYRDYTTEEKTEGGVTGDTRYEENPDFEILSESTSRPNRYVPLAHPITHDFQLFVKI